MDQVFAVIVPAENSLTTPIAAGVELSKLYIMAAKKVQALAEETHTVTDDDGTIHIVDNPHLRWWFDQTRRLATDVAKITANAQIKAVDHQLQLAQMFMNSDILTKEQQEAVIMMQHDRLQQTPPG